MGFDPVALELLLLVFGLLAVIGIFIGILRVMSNPVVTLVVVGILGWLAFFYALGVDKVQ